MSSCPTPEYGAPDIHASTRKDTTMSKLFGRPEDVQASRDADAALHDLQQREEAAGITHETDEYLRLNSAANEAAAALPWWRR